MPQGCQLNIYLMLFEEAEVSAIPMVHILEIHLESVFLGLVDSHLIIIIVDREFISELLMKYFAARNIS